MQGDDGERTNFKLTQNIHKRVKTFEYCEKSYSCKSALDYHKNIHNGIKPFKCTECGRSFASKNNLQGHVRIHSSKAF